MKTTKSKYLSSGSVLLALLSFPASIQSAPMLSVGDNVDVFFNSSSSLRWTSNVFSNEEEVDDLIWTISPGFEVNVGRSLSNADLSIITRYDIVQYDDLDDSDAELFHITADGSYQSTRLELTGSVSYDEIKATQGDLNVQDLVEWDSVAARLEGEYRVSPKFTFGSGVRYSEREYQTYKERLAGLESVTIPLDVFYALTPKVDLSLGYSYKETDVGAAGTASAREDISHFYNVGVRGQLLPKLFGNFKIGYRTRESDLNQSRETEMLGLNADFTWSATPKVTAIMGLSRDFDFAAQGVGTEISRINLNASYSLNSKWSSSATSSYMLKEYATGREDDQYTLGLQFSYEANQYWRFSGGYTYTEYDSNEDNRSYETNTLNITANLRY